MEKIIGKTRKLKKQTRYNISTYAIVVIFFAVFELLSASGSLSRSWSGLLVPICVYVTAAIALNLVVGISGELSLGHAGFLSIGAFSGVVVSHLLIGVGSDFLRLLISMICGGIISGIFGFIIGIPVLRLRGDYLAIVTLAFGEIIRSLIQNVYLGYDSSGWHFRFAASSLDLEEGGVAVINGPMGVTGNEKLSTFFMGFLLIMFTLTVVLNLKNSRTGRAIMAIRDNRIAAESVGLQVASFKLTAFVTSAFLTGMAGALYVMNYASIAASKFNFNTSILILVFVVMGGMGNIRGSIIAAVILYVLPEQLRAVGDYRMIIYAVLLISMMLLTQSDGGKRLIMAIAAPFGGILWRKDNRRKKAKGNE